MKIIIFGGGTHFYIRPHLALSAPARGTTARDIVGLVETYHDLSRAWKTDPEIVMALTKMAGGDSLDTNADIAKYIDEQVLPDPEVKVVFMTAALCDFEVQSIDKNGWDAKPIGKEHPRLRTEDYKDIPLELSLKPSIKLINKIRKTRKDIFLVGFKTTAGFSEDDQFEAGLRLLKTSSCNLVLANDVHTRVNMVITPEQARYYVTKTRAMALTGLVRMTAARADDDFTRSTVVDGELVNWRSDAVPSSLRTVVDHLVKRGAYRPFLGATVGHFAVKVEDNKFLTSIRKMNYNKLDEHGLVMVTTDGNNKVIAHGAKPSVGGQSQRIIFANHPGYDCIAHAHVKLRPGSKVPVRPQWQNECGSMRCGQNTSDGLQDFDGIKAVMLENHGPNVVFRRGEDPAKVIKFFEDNFDLEHQTSESANLD